MDSEQIQRVERARVHLNLDYPFYGYILMQLNLNPDNSIPTAATDGYSIIYNTDFIKSLNNKQIKTVLAHEVEHIIDNHHIRMQGRDHESWNKATDYVINYDLIYNEKLTEIPGILLDDRFKDFSSEKTYSLVEQEKKKNKNGKEGSQGKEGKEGKEGKNFQSIGDVLPSKSGKSLSEEKERTKELMQNGINYAKKMGKLPGHLERRITKSLQPKIPWQRLIRDWIEAKIKEDFNWLQRDNRILDFHFPSLYLEEEEIGYIVIAIDTSGSIDETLLNTFVTEINNLRKVFKFKTTIICCDSYIQSINNYNENDEIEITPKGGGGTAFSPVFNKVAEFTKKPIGLLYFTDLYCYDFGNPVDYDVLWLSYGGESQVPFGKIINMRE